MFAGRLKGLREEALDSTVASNRHLMADELEPGAYVTPSVRLVRVLADAGTVTLSIYLLHALIPAALFRWLYHDQQVGVGWALIIALSSWTSAMVIGALWVRRVGAGPAERLLRAIGGR